MRLLELFISILLATYFLWPRPRPFIIRALPVTVLVLTILHFTLEGYRWQMIPLYALTIIFAALSLCRLQSQEHKSLH